MNTSRLLERWPSESTTGGPQCRLGRATGDLPYPYKHTDICPFGHICTRDNDFHPVREQNQLAKRYHGLSVAGRRADPTPRHASRRLGAFVVSPVHRFLHQQQPDSQGTPRVWLLHGPPILDLYLHNLYHGCVALRRTVELWGIEEWAGDPQPFTVTFTVNGELDFNGNADPQDARARFDAMRNPRPPRFGHRRKRPPTGASGAGADDSADETSQAAQQAAAATQTHVGGGRQLINRMQQIAAALRSGNGDRIIVIVDELSHQLERLSP